MLNIELALKDVNFSGGCFFNIFHRLFGNCPRTDIDSIEYDKYNKRVAVIEAKHGNIKEIKLNTIQYERLYDLAKDLNLPLFYCVYYILNENGYQKYKCLNEKEDNIKDATHVQVYVVPANDKAESIITTGTAMMSSLEYCNFMRSLRGEPVMTDKEIKITGFSNKKYCLTTPEILE